ncbi:MAG: hypothetical protein AB7V77_05245 [Candidatus Woesearchaeota archaeon]
MLVKMLEDITTDETCRKDDIVVAKYLYDGKYQLLHKYLDKDKKPIEFQCYEHQIEILTEQQANSFIVEIAFRKMRKFNSGIEIYQRNIVLDNVVIDEQVLYRPKTINIPLVKQVTKKVNNCRLLEKKQAKYIK